MFRHSSLFLALLSLAASILPVYTNTLPLSPQAEVESPPKYHGDYLNTTRCYCASPNWRSDHVYGYYYLITYYNSHLDRLFPLELTCKSDDGKRYSSPYVQTQNPKQPECLRERFGEKHCEKYEAGHKFCYKLNGGTWDDFRFDGQKRGVPLYPDVDEGVETVERVCGDMCREKVGGLDMLKDEAWRKVMADPLGLGGRRLRWSHVASYMDIDDMCDNCA